MLDRGDEGGGGAEDAVEVGVDVGFDVDWVRGRGVVDEGDEDAQGDAEHGGAGGAEVGRGGAGGLEGFLALLAKGYHFGQEDDILPVQLHARSVHLQPVVVAV